MKLYLCEKPSQARDIARVLGASTKANGCLKGDGVVISWCFGHLLEMAPPDAYDPAHKKWQLETLPILPGEWKMEAKAASSKQLRIVRDLLKQTRHLVIATDADREGETIAREILDHCRWRGTITRLWLSALDDASIRKALGNILPGSKTEPLYRAGVGRARADWLVGMNLTRAYTLLGRRLGHEGVLSVGRVQTPTLNLIVQRDRQIENFVATPYFEVTATLTSGQGTFTAKWLPATEHADTEGRCNSASTARTVAQRIKGKTGTVTRYETSREKQAPPLPFDLSGLQQAASKRWSMGAQEVLDTAQALYETHKALSYPRTDCPYLPESQFGEAAAVLAALKQSLPDYARLIDQADSTLRSKAWNDAKITAHHAIIPTQAMVDVSRMNEREQRLYDMVCRRYLAQFYPAHERDKSRVELTVDGENFRATGFINRVTGWRAVLRDDDDEQENSAPLPPLSQGMAVTAVESGFESKQTQPPARFTEGTLIAAMKSVGKEIDDPELRKVLRETSGIGTEATRAGIIETLLQRKLIQRQKKQLISTPAGRSLIDMVPDEIKNPITTAVWEQALDDIAQDKGSLESFLRHQADWIGKILRQSLSTSLPDQPQAKVAQPSHPCPECGQPMYRRNGKKGWFWGCSGYPTCKATLPDFHGEPQRKSPEPRTPITPGRIGDTCPSCRKGKLLLRTIKNGKNSRRNFIGCTHYPKCDYFAWHNEH